jgi:bifunctional UDP-N-acetylglucosamine pyrophosphorylase / glucosamine-1-phosphate N-acetyltransferase
VCVGKERHASIFRFYKFKKCFKRSVLSSKEVKMHKSPLAAIILAAGKGTRMHSTRHKVLHPIGARPMIGHLLDAVDTLNPAQKVVVVGALKEQLQAALPDVTLVTQEPQLGTGHAVLSAKPALAGFAGDILILYGDVPLVSTQTMQRLLAALNTPLEKTSLEQTGTLPDIAVLGFRPADPAAYGRILTNADGTIAQMVEFKDASPAQRAIGLCNSGMMAVRSRVLFTLLERLDNNNAAGEYYLPDIVMRATSPSVVVETSAEEVAGVNSRVELAQVEALFQQRKRQEAMLAGVTLIAPETVFFAHDTRLGSDVVVEPFVVFGPGVQVEAGAVIRAHSHLEGCLVRTGAEVGPYARLRTKADIGSGVKIGNFVEVKNTTLEAGAKANHLTYLGDAHVGTNANIGAGTITCNYDGFLKYQTHIGAGAFIGSNSALVAPVKIAAGAIVGAGSVISHDVEANALSLTRAEQKSYALWAEKFRDKKRREKALK